MRVASSLLLADDLGESIIVDLGLLSLARCGNKSRSSIAHLDIVIVVALFLAAFIVIVLVLDDLQVLGDSSSALLEPSLDSLNTREVSFGSLLSKLHDLFCDRNLALVFTVKVKLILHDLQQDGFDIELVGIGTVGEEITNGTSEPVALCRAVGAAPVAGDGDGEGGPKAQSVPDAEIEVGLNCF